MQKIEVDAMTALVDGGDMPPERGDICGWGWTHWDGPDYGKLYKVYQCAERKPNERPVLWYEIYVEGEKHSELVYEMDFRQWALDNGWRPVISYTSEGGRVGYSPLKS